MNGKLSGPAALLLPLFLFISSCVYYTAESSGTPLSYYDEVMWSGKSYFFDLLLHDRNNALWQSVYSYDQPKLVEFAFGSILYPSYISKKKIAPSLSYFTFLSGDRLLCGECIDGANAPKGTTISYYRQYAENPDSPEYDNMKRHVRQLRMLNIFIAGGTAVLIYFVGYSLWGYAGGLLFAILYATNSLIVRTVTLAHADSFLLFFMILFYLTLHTHTIRPRIGLLILGFICIGLAASTKIVGFVLLLPTGIYLLSLLLTRPFRWRTVFSVMFGTLTGVVLMSFIFLFFNPYVRTNTIERASIMYRHRASQEQDAAREDPRNRLTSPAGRIASVIRRMYGPGYSYIYPSGLPDGYGQVRWIYILLYAAGLVSICSVRPHDNRPFFARYFLIICTAAMLSTMEFWLIIGWERYYSYILPLVLGTTVEGIVYLGRMAANILNQKTDSGH